MPSPIAGEKHSLAGGVATKLCIERLVDATFNVMNYPLHVGVHVCIVALLEGLQLLNYRCTQFILKILYKAKKKNIHDIVRVHSIPIMCMQRKFYSAVV